MKIKITWLDIDYFLLLSILLLFFFFSLPTKGLQNRGGRFLDFLDFQPAATGG
jgi:hypothetical protein